jgi:nucleoside-diphosphate-sugar epimerase
MFFDLFAFLFRTSLPISSIRVKKFCSDSQFGTSLLNTGFKAKFSLEDGIKRTIEYEFINDNSSEHKFISE